jgi:hypothetical protein
VAISFPFLLSRELRDVARQTQLADDAAQIRHDVVQAVLLIEPLADFNLTGAGRTHIEDRAADIRLVRRNSNSTLAQCTSRRRAASELQRRIDRSWGE